MSSNPSERRRSLASISDHSWPIRMSFISAVLEERARNPDILLRTISSRRHSVSQVRSPIAHRLCQCDAISPSRNQSAFSLTSSMVSMASEAEQLDNSREEVQTQTQSTSSIRTQLQMGSNEETVPMDSSEENRQTYARSMQSQNFEFMKRRQSQLPTPTSPNDTNLLKYNSCSTLFIDETLMKGDIEERLKCLSLTLYCMLKQAPEFPKSNEIFSEELFPLSDSHFYSGAFMTTEAAIYNFLFAIYENADYSPETIIIALIYLERLLSCTGLDFHSTNWARMILGAIVLAVKIWDDLAVWNTDFTRTFPEASVEALNDLERWYFQALGFDVNVKSSTYTQYYFALRGVVESCNRTWTLRPLTVREASRLEATSDYFTKVRKRTKAVSNPRNKALFEEVGMRRALSDTLFEPRSPAVLMHPVQSFLMDKHRHFRLFWFRGWTYLTDVLNGSFRSVGIPIVLPSFLIPGVVFSSLALSYYGNSEDRFKELAKEYERVYGKKLE